MAVAVVERWPLVEVLLHGQNLRQSLRQLDVFDNCSDNIKTLALVLLRGQGAITFPAYVEYSFMDDMLTFHHVCLLERVLPFIGYKQKRLLGPQKGSNHWELCWQIILDYTVVTYW